MNNDTRNDVWELSNDRVTAEFVTASDGGLRIRSFATADGTVSLEGADRSSIPAVGDVTFRVSGGETVCHGDGTEL
ncbi:MAG: hypothetical protein H0W23_03000, partial [Chloroflexia bacterium]|nr:hypothetical protein [Chloroflexia bacterium]